MDDSHLGGRVRRFATLIRTARNLKLWNDLFLELSISYFWTMVVCG